MSPIEHRWDILTTKYHCSNAGSTREEWEAIPQQDIRRLVHSVRRLHTALIQANGGHTRYGLCSVIRKLPGILYFYCSYVFVINVW